MAIMEFGFAVAEKTATVASEERKDDGGEKVELPQLCGALHSWGRPSPRNSQNPPRGQSQPPKVSVTALLAPPMIGLMAPPARASDVLFLPPF